MKKIAQIVNETPDFAWSSEGCTPCECGDSIACLQEKVPVLEAIPSDVLGYAMQAVIIVWVVLIIIFFVLIFSKLVRMIYHKFIS